MEAGELDLRSSRCLPRDIREPVEMAGGRRKLVTSDELTTLAELLLDTIVMKDSQSNLCLPDPAGTDENE